MVFNATFNNISAISWRLVLLLEETRVPTETHRPVASHWQTLSHNVVEYISLWTVLELRTIVTSIHDVLLQQIFRTTSINYNGSTILLLGVCVCVFNSAAKFNRKDILT